MVSLGPVSTKCAYDRAWVGPCGEPTEGEQFCSKHRKQCVSCGATAIRECESTFMLVCGAPLCHGCHDTGTGAHVRTPGVSRAEDEPKSFWERLKNE